MDSGNRSAVVVVVMSKLLAIRYHCFCRNIFPGSTCIRKGTILANSNGRSRNLQNLEFLAYGAFWVPLLKDFSASRLQTLPGFNTRSITAESPELRTKGRLLESIDMLQSWHFLSVSMISWHSAFLFLCINLLLARLLYRRCATIPNSKGESSFQLSEMSVKTAQKISRTIADVEFPFMFMMGI